MEIVVNDAKIRAVQWEVEHHCTGSIFERFGEDEITTRLPLQCMLCGKVVAKLSENPN